MRVFASFAPVVLFTAAAGLLAQQRPGSSAILPDAPSQVLFASASQATEDSIQLASTSADSQASDGFSSSLAPVALYDFSFAPPGYQQNSAQPPAQNPAVQKDDHKKKHSYAGADTDEKGNPIPLERRQPTRILGFMPNYRTVSAGAAVHPPGWKYNFHVATHQSLDYSTFIFLGLTSLTAEGLNSHPALGKGVGGFYAYTWRGFLDKTDGTFLGAWLLPSLLHEDTRYYPLGHGHSIPTRALYVISRQGVARTYSGHQTPNIAGLGAKVLTQLISREYYPTSATSFSVLATKFGYSAMRDVAFSSIREFYPDIAAHYIRKHREKVAAQAAHDATSSGVPTQPKP